MTKQELIDLLNAWENLPILVEEIGSQPELFAILMDIALNNPEQRSWRAAYLADQVHDRYPELLLPYFKKMIVKLRTENNSSKKRHFLKLLSMNDIPEQHFGFLVDYFCISIDLLYFFSLILGFVFENDLYMFFVLFPLIHLN